MIEAMKQALEVIETAIKAGDWKVDGACDPDNVIHGLRQAIADLESQERNFCPRCGKRTNDIHTCTPPQRTWVELTNDELTDLFYNTNLGQQSAVSQAIALLKERNS